MSTFNETGLGGVLAAGCVSVALVDNFHTTYGQGDSAYSIDKAKVGVLEKIVIKKQRVIQNIKTHGELRVLYIDTFNAFWSEDDLVTFVEAQSLAVAYLQSCIIDLDKFDVCN